MPRLLLALLLFAVPFARAAAEKPVAPPNVVLFLTDDESWLERSAYGWSKLPTPHFDRVARDGILFTHGYASAPSCAPSRASILTGHNFWELEEGAFIQAWLPEKFPVLPDLLTAGGYHAGFTGKGWGPGVSPPSGGRRNPAGTAYNDAKRATPEAGISPIDYAANFERFLAARPAGKPFGFWVGTSEPHDPVGPDNYLKLAAQHGLSLDAVKVPGFLPDTPGIRRHRANMLYEVCHADADLGRILQILEERGELSNTLVIVTSDNGTQLLRSKANAYDWGVREPLAIMWPARIKPGRRVDDFVNFADLAPTILHAAGLSVPPSMSGRSFLDILLSPASGRIDPTRGWTVAGLEWHGELEPVNLAVRMIRDERYQYLVNYGTGPRLALSDRPPLPDVEFERTAGTASEIELILKHPNHPTVKPFLPLLRDPRPREELYDCEADPWELKNLADSPAHAAVKARLKAQLEAYQRQTKDPRITGDMTVFDRTRAYVQKRKTAGYKN